MNKVSGGFAQKWLELQAKAHCKASTFVALHNSHLGLLRSEHCRVGTAQSTRAVAYTCWRSHRKPKLMVGM